MIEPYDDPQFLPMVDYNSPDWFWARDMALQRDGRKCRICKRSTDLNAHHIGYGEDNYNPDNLVTLCRTCHKIITDMVETGKQADREFKEKQRSIMTDAALKMYKASVLNSKEDVPFLQLDTIKDVSTIISETFRRQALRKQYLLGIIPGIQGAVSKYRANAYNYYKSEGFSDPDIMTFLKLNQSQLYKIKEKSKKLLESGEDEKE